MFWGGHRVGILGGHHLDKRRSSRRSEQISAVAKAALAARPRVALSFRSSGNEAARGRPFRVIAALGGGATAGLSESCFSHAPGLMPTFLMYAAPLVLLFFLNALVGTCG